MLKLDKFTTTMLLITKGWEHKDIPKVDDESIAAYSRKVFALFIGVEPTQVDTTHLWLDLIEELLTKQELLKIISRFCFSQAEVGKDSILIGSLQTIRVQGRFELSKWDQKKENK